MPRQALTDAFRHAADGIAAAACERNFKIELCFAVLAIILGVALRIDFTQWAVVSICIGVVLALECLNTSLEALVDLVSPDYHDLAKIAKDCAAGAVLVCSVCSLFVAAFIYLPRIVALIQNVI